MRTGECESRLLCRHSSCTRAMPVRHVDDPRVISRVSQVHETSPNFNCDCAMTGIADLVHLAERHATAGPPVAQQQACSSWGIPWTSLQDQEYKLHICNGHTLRQAPHALIRSCTATTTAAVEILTQRHPHPRPLECSRSTQPSGRHFHVWVPLVKHYHAPFCAHHMALART